jgi:hypothetical protein
VDVSDKLLQAVLEAAEIMAGSKDPARVHLAPGTVDLRAIRERLGLSQPFRLCFGDGARLGAGHAAARAGGAHVAAGDRSDSRGGDRGIGGGAEARMNGACMTATMVIDGDRA